MGEEAEVRGGQPWRFDIRIVSLDDLPQDVEGVAVLWAKGEVRKSTPVCVATSGRAVFETPPVLGLETMLKMNDETHIFDDKFLRFSVKKAVDQRLSPLGQFLIKVSRFASTPSVQSEVKRVPLTIGNDKGKATVSYTVTCFPATEETSAEPTASVVSNVAPPPPVPAFAAPASHLSVAPPAPPMPRDQPPPSAAQLGSENIVAAEGNSFVAVSSPVSATSILGSTIHTVAPRNDGAPNGVAAPLVRAPSVPKSAVKLNHLQDRLEASQHQLRKVDVSAQDLHHLQLDDVNSFDRDSLLQLSALLLSRQNASSGSVFEPASASVSSAIDLPSENARLKATVDILKGRVASEAGVGLGYDSVSYLQTELISAMVRIAQLEADNAELKFVASRSEFEVAENKARAAAHRNQDVVSKQQLSETNQQSGGAAAKAVVSVGAGVTVGGSPVVSKEQQQPAKIEIANDEEDVRAYAKYLGLDPDVDKALMWIAVEGLSAPLPENWSEHVDENGNLFYWNKEQSTSQWDHPCDDIYKAFVRDAKKEMTKKGSKAKSYLTRPDPLKK